MSTKLEELYRKIDDLKKEAEDLANKEKASVISEIRNKIVLYNITLKDLGLRASSGRQTASVAKYHLGGNTWSGKGRQPRWVLDHLASGGKLEDLLVS